MVSFVQMAAQAFIFLTIALAIGELLNIFNLVYQRNPKSRNKPIKGYLQLIKLIIFIVCGLMILGTFLKKDVFTLLAGFGAMAAVLMLVFQNTILSLVASVQISSYDMVRIGDWIEMPSLNADGDVIDMSLHTITVQNFDKTFTTIPTNKLVTDTFKNWRGMSQAGLQPTEKGLPLEIYAFSNQIAWKDYEAIQSDIFDHLIAILPEFGLKVYQAPSGYDMQIALSNP
ncbi:hypothetical protein LTR94_021167 [Friedmanniomyces endolithicus]|nr:hypothetical protein LTR94_021167 [Friedmanniomyces endolithicus]